MSSLEIRFIDEIFRCLARKDVTALAKHINIRNPQYAKLYFKEDSKRYVNDKLRQATNEVNYWCDVIQYYMLARNSLYNQDVINAFEYLNKSFKALIDVIKDARDENWQLPIMFRMSVDLRLLAYTCDAMRQRNQLTVNNRTESGKDAEGSSNQDDFAEKTAESLMTCFRNICTDTRSDTNVGKYFISCSECS